MYKDFMSLGRNVPFILANCGVIGALNSHIPENHQNPEKSIDSPKVVPDLVVHKRIVQKAEIFHSCNFCELQTKYPNNLERHTQLHQNDRKRKKENTASQKATLKKQKLNMEESFPCDECGFIFSRKGNLKRH